MTENFARLYSKQGENFCLENLNTYPRPQLKRDSFLSLNGQWDFEISESSSVPSDFSRKICVPFAPESALSGVEEVFDEKYFRYYKKEFSLPHGFLRDRVILHFGAVDSECEVFLNGVSLGTHRGGYDAFSFDITERLKENNTLTLRVWDYLSSKILPYGKQCYKRGGMWYTPVSGIWQTVWLESVAYKYIKSLEIKTDKNIVSIFAEGVDSGEITVQTPDGEIGTELKEGKAQIKIENPNLWSPENPYLYYFTIESEGDRVESYFALRTLEIKNVNGKARLCLNGKPYFFHGLLDQGYFCDGIFTPASMQCYEEDILSMKALGFNMLRKHIKIEPEQFYYDCDRLGMVVFQDMINNSDYSFLRDTALPTVFMKTLGDKYLHRNKKSRAAFVEHMEKTVKTLSNHPCICYWTIFNEGWGQFESGKMYKKLKSLDDTRFVDSASGWFKGAESDVVSDHVYFKSVKFKPSNKPTVLSEFGGYSFREEGHIFNLTKFYGYGSFEKREEFENAFVSLYENEVIPAAEKGLSAAVYTQISDVEDETNGLLTYDRKVLKVTSEKLLPIAEKLKQAVKK